MMRAPPGLPRLISNWPLSRSNTRVGDIDERGRLPGSTRLATGRPWASAGTKLKSVSWLFSRKPPGRRWVGADHEAGAEAGFDGGGHGQALPWRRPR
jgi:hypothetical protein